MEEKTLEEVEAELAEGVKEAGKHCDPTTLRRFARGNPDLAVLLRSLEWREKAEADTILQDGFLKNKNMAPLLQYWPGKWHGADKEGAPIWIEKTGKLDVRGLCNAVPEGDFLHYHIYTQEATIVRNQNVSKELNKEIYSNIIVWDFAGFGMEHIYGPAIDAFKKLVVLDEENYPGDLKYLFAVNCPSIFSIVYKLCSPVVDKKTLDKVFVLGGPREYVPQLLKYIDADQLPEEYGGNCKCEGGCLPAGGPYIDLNPDGTTRNPASVTVSRGAKHEVEITVDKTNALVSWVFSVKHYDIGFEILAGQERQVLVPMQRYNSVETKGQFTATTPGPYFFIWDNSFAYFHKKNVTYQIFVESKKKKKAKNNAKKTTDDGAE